MKTYYIAVSYNNILIKDGTIMAGRFISKNALIEHLDKTFGKGTQFKIKEIFIKE